MAFNVSEFKSTISKHGLKGTNKFVVNMSLPPAMSANFDDPLFRQESDSSRTAAPEVADPRLLQMLCDTANIPGKNLETIDYKPMGYGGISKMPTGVSMDSLNLTFMLDSDHRVEYFFQYWLQEIINTGSILSGPAATFKNRTAFEMAYKDNYVCELSLRFFADEGKFIEYRFMDVYPVQIGSVQLGWEQNDQIARLPVEFTYYSYDVFQGKLDYPVNDTRGNNLFQTIAVLGSVAGVINNIRRPRSVQDAINQFTRIDNLSKNLDRIF